MWVCGLCVNMRVSRYAATRRVVAQRTKVPTSQTECCAHDTKEDLRAFSTSKLSMLPSGNDIRIIRGFALLPSAVFGFCWGCWCPRRGLCQSHLLTLGYRLCRLGSLLLMPSLFCLSSVVVSGLTETAK